jgi:hypothetical protein
VGVGSVGGVEGGGALGADLGGGAVVDRRRGVQADAGVAVVMVVIVEEGVAEGAGVFDAAEVGWEGGAVLEGLVDRFGVGVVVGDVRGEWVRPMPRSARSSATPLEVIEVPRSAWMVRAARSIPWAPTAAVMKASASSAVSVVATIQPTT